MKNINLTIISILLLTFSSCEDQLDQAPLSNPSAANFYRNTTDFEKAVNGIYNTLNPGPNVTDGSQAINGYAIRRFELAEIRSDNVYSPGTGVRDWNPINNFEKTLATNPNMNEAWYANYLGILRANSVLDNLNAVVVPDESKRNQMEGEAKFLRAFFILI